MLGVGRGKALVAFRNRAGNTVPLIRFFSEPLVPSSVFQSTRYRVASSALRYPEECAPSLQIPPESVHCSLSGFAK